MAVGPGCGFVRAEAQDSGRRWKPGGEASDRGGPGRKSPSLNGTNMLFQKKGTEGCWRDASTGRRDTGGMPAGCVGEHAGQTDTYNGDKDNFNGEGMTHKEGADM